MAPLPKLYFIMTTSQNTNKYKQFIILPLPLVVKRTLSLLSCLYLEKLNPDCHFPAHDSILPTFSAVELTDS